MCVAHLSPRYTTQKIISEGNVPQTPRTQSKKIKFAWNPSWYIIYRGYQQIKLSNARNPLDKWTLFDGKWLFPFESQTSVLSDSKFNTMNLCKSKISHTLLNHRSNLTSRLVWALWAGTGVTQNLQGKGGKLAGRKEDPAHTVDKIRLQSRFHRFLHRLWEGSCKGPSHGSTWGRAKAGKQSTGQGRQEAWGRSRDGGGERAVETLNTPAARTETMDLEGDIELIHFCLATSAHFCEEYWSPVSQISRWLPTCICLLINQEIPSSIPNQSPLHKCLL